MQTVYVAVDVLLLHDPNQLSCRHCGQSLSMHQPDPDYPERMLATCPDCRSWYLIDCVAGAMVLLPSADELSTARARSD